MASATIFMSIQKLLPKQADKIYAATDAIAERVRKLGASTRVEYLTPIQMLKELRDDNLQLATYLREAHGVYDDHGDVASAGLLGSLSDDAEQRTWYLFETCWQKAAPEESSG